MLTVAYCRVSTEEQAAEGFSIAGQADKLRVYAELHDLGEVTVIADPGLSRKNLERPGLQQLLHMVEEGHVANVLTWRLDRSSSNLGDLIMLADRFGQAGVALHSFTEKIDLSSATGRMFYNILGSFAQFYREQLAENVRMGMQQAVRQGKWVNRPKTGYDLVDGELVPNEMAPVVRRIFTLRAEGQSQGKIADATGVKYSTVLSILGSRIYLGEVQMNGEWFPGKHEAIVTREVFAAAHRGRIKGRPRGTDLLSGRVRCGLCRLLMAIDSNGEGRKLYRCRHRGQGCAQPSRTNVGLLRAAVLGSRHVAEDMVGQRRKLLRLYYADKIGADLFAEEEARLSVAIREAQREADEAQGELARSDDVAQHFDAVARMLASLDVDKTWNAATELERRVLIDEFLEEISVLPDYRLFRFQRGEPRQATTIESRTLKLGLPA